MIKWSKKEAILCLQELRNPFEGIKQSKGILPNLAERIKELAGRNRGVKP